MLAIRLLLHAAATSAHLVPRPANSTPLCIPYPGCPPPDVRRSICPYKWEGELCGVLTRAHKRLPSLANGTQPSLLVDVGAAFGTQIWIGREFGHPVLAIECRADEAARLRTQFAHDSMVRVVNVCLSSEAGVSLLHRAADSSSLHRGTFGRKELSKAHKEVVVERRANATEEVRTARLDDLLLERLESSKAQLAALGMSRQAYEADATLRAMLRMRVGVLKTDTQGHEASVLRGALGVIVRDRPVLYYEDMMNGAARGGKLLQQVLKVRDSVQNGNTVVAPQEPPHYRCACDPMDCECH